MKKGLKWMAGLLTLAMVVGSFAGCGSSSSKETAAAGESAAATTAESTAETAGKKLKVALILPGKKDDVSFNQAMYEGMKKYADANPDKIDLNVTENVYEVADIEPALMDFADQGFWSWLPVHGANRQSWRSVSGYLFPAWYRLQITG